MSIVRNSPDFRFFHTAYSTRKPLKRQNFSAFFPYSAESDRIRLYHLFVQLWPAEKSERVIDDKRSRPFNSSFAHLAVVSLRTVRSKYGSYPIKLID